MPEKKELRPRHHRHHHHKQSEPIIESQSEIQELKSMMYEMMEKLNSLTVLGSEIPKYKPANLADIIAPEIVQQEVEQYIPDIEISPKSRTRSSVKKTRGEISLGVIDKLSE